MYSFLYLALFLFFFRTIQEKVHIRTKQKPNLFLPNKEPESHPPTATTTTSNFILSSHIPPHATRKPPKPTTTHIHKNQPAARTHTPNEKQKDVLPKK